MLLSLCGVAAAWCSALALYASSAHCRWPRLAGHRTVSATLGTILALMSLLAWSALLGFGAGLCAMLGSWMLALIALPWLALRAARTAAP